MVKQTKTIYWQESTDCLSVFDNFVGLELKWLMTVLHARHNCLVTLP